MASQARLTGNPTSLQDRFQAVIDGIQSGDLDNMGANATLFQPVLPAQNSATSPSFGLNNNGTGSSAPLGGSLSSGGNAIASAASAAGITGGSTAPSGTTGSATASGSGQANNWFVRGVIVVLGFIFVGVGLSQFGVAVPGLRRP